MRQLNEHHSFTGMQRDISPSKHPANFLYDAKNIRLTQREGDTLLTISNEKGPLNTTIAVQGKYLGHCQLNNYIVVFSTGHKTIEGTPTKVDYITLIDLNGEGPTSDILFEGDLNFEEDAPIEAIGSYENDDVQKVYWTDGVNQPRVINIKGTTFTKDSFDFIPKLELKEEVHIQKELGTSGMFPAGVIQYAFTYYMLHGQESNIFYTSPLLYTSHDNRGGSPEDKVSNSFKINIKNPDTKFYGLNIYSIQRTSLDGTPIVKKVQSIRIPDEPTIYSEKYLVSDTAPVFEGSITNSQFLANSTHLVSGITGSNVLWSYIVYDAQQNSDLEVSIDNGRTVVWGNNNTLLAWCKYPNDNNGKYYIVQCKGNTPAYGVNLSTPYHYTYKDITFVDNGFSGEAIDPTELLYKGGEAVKAGTIEQKDGTLFLGNLELSSPTISEEIKNNLKSRGIVTTGYRYLYLGSPSKLNPEDEDIYPYQSQLNAFSDEALTNSVPCGGFKTHNYYRLGLQFQDETGKWSEPVYLSDANQDEAPSLDSFQRTIGEGGTWIGGIYYPNGIIVYQPRLKLPAFRKSILGTEAQDLIALGYKKVRPVVVFPQIQDRRVLCQGVRCPTVYTSAQRNAKTLYAQSSWFFRPMTTESLIDGTKAVVSPQFEDGTQLKCWSKDDKVPVNQGGSQDRYDSLRLQEIQGYFDSTHQFTIDWRFCTFHSSDIEFDSYLSSVDLLELSYYKVGKASFSKTLSTISIQTSTPTIGEISSADDVGNTALGADPKSFVSDGSKGIVSGLFYEDYIVSDNNNKFGAYGKSPIRWLVYPWQRSGSLNNDIERPEGKGVRSANLKKKVISNLRYSTTSYLPDYGIGVSGEVVAKVNLSDSSNPALWNSDQSTIIKVGDNIYQGNIDTLLVQSASSSMYGAFGSASYGSTTNGNTTILNNAEVDTPFNSTFWFKTWKNVQAIKHDNVEYDSGMRAWLPDPNNNNNYRWLFVKKGGIDDDDEGDGDYLGKNYPGVGVQKESVRMKYKSSPHIVLDFSNDSALPALVATPYLEVGELRREVSRELIFGGASESALQANKWIPCGEPVELKANGTSVQYSYGDTYYQRYDCLKTYPFTSEDINQIVEIGSFMLETYVNIDGRYDRNRGQLNNLNVNPTNFNLINPVYSQTNNFFTYRIMDKEITKIKSFPNQITWSKEKSMGGEIDLWTNITLASTYDVDGSKGPIESINLWNNQLFCFQPKGVSNILFNSRVQIPTSDGLPIEITNSYKVDGFRYILDGVGCSNKWTVKETPAGIYFIDSVSNHLYSVGASSPVDITLTHNMSSWFKDHEIKRTIYDDVNKDIYLLVEYTEYQQEQESLGCLCFSELLGQFTSFMDYNDLKFMCSHEGKVFGLNQSPNNANGGLYRMFAGAYNVFFTQSRSEPWYFTFISNGVDNGMQDMHKIFSTIDYRMDADNAPDTTLTHIRVTNEYQDTGKQELKRFSGLTNHFSEANLQKKFRTWRIQIPRDQSGGNGRDRIANHWCKITLGNENGYNRVVLHDLNVQYFI